MLSENASLIRWLRQCQKSGQKADYIQCRARLASFGAGKMPEIGEKLWQLDGIISLTEIYVRGHQISDLEHFMGLLVYECGYHWRLQVNTCAKGVHHPQGKESECMSCCHDGNYKQIGCTDCLQVIKIVSRTWVNGTIINLWGATHLSNCLIVSFLSLKLLHTCQHHLLYTPILFAEHQKEATT